MLAMLAIEFRTEIKPSAFTVLATEEVIRIEELDTKGGISVAMRRRWDSERIHVVPPVSEA
jgi:hypothetical protein